MAAVAAVLRVGRVLHLGQRLRVVGEAEVGHALSAAPEVGDERVVRVQDEARAPVEAGDDLCPAVGEQLELAVAVELVAEQVGEQDEARLEVLCDASEPGFVDLEQPELTAAPSGVEERRRHSPGHVRAGPVVHHLAARALERRRRSWRRWWSCRSSPRRARSPHRGRPTCAEAPPARGAAAGVPGRSSRPCARDGGSRPAARGRGCARGDTSGRCDHAEAARLDSQGGGGGADRVAVRVDDEGAVGGDFDQLAAQELGVR